MSFRSLGVLFVGIVLAMPLAASTVRIYVTNRGGTTIDVVDPATNKVVESIGGFISPESVRFSPDGKRMYVTSRSNENVLEVRDRKSGKTIKKVPLSGWANDFAVTSDGKLILVCIRNTGGSFENEIGALDVVSADTLTKVKSIPAVKGLHDIEVSRDNKYAAVGSEGARSLIVYDLQKMEAIWQVQYDQAVLPLQIENGPDGSPRRIFAQLNATNGFSVVDFATRKEVARITHPDEPTGFGVGCEGTSHGLGISPNGKTLWANSRAANAVFVYSLPEVKLLGHVSLPEVKVPGKSPRGGGPAWITFTPDSKTVYVSTCGTKTISAIDTEAMKEVARVPVGEGPDRISTLVLP